MKMTIKYILIVFVFNSCSYSPKEIYNNKSLSESNAENIENSADSLNIIIDINKIKQKYSQFSTTSVIPNRLINNICSSDTGGIFGAYTLVDNETLDRIGQLIVFYPGNAATWRYDCKNEKFIEYYLFKGDLIFIDSIKIGIPEQLLMKRVGRYSPSKDSNAIHLDTKSYSYNFILTNDTLSMVEIIRNCKN